MRGAGRLVGPPLTSGIGYVYAAGRRWEASRSNRLFEGGSDVAVHPATIDVGDPHVAARDVPRLRRDPPRHRARPRPTSAPTREPPRPRSRSTRSSTTSIPASAATSGATAGWLQGFVTGDWPRSIKGRREVWPELKDAMANSLRLGIVASVVGITIGLGLGIFAALRPGSLRDTSVNTGAFVAFSIPPYVSAVLLQLLFAVMWSKWFGNTLLPDLRRLPAGPPGIRPVADVQAHDPAGDRRGDPDRSPSTRGTCGRRCSRSSTATTCAPLAPRASASGGSSMHHAVRNAMIPVVTVAAIDIGGILGGLIITERIFEYPGMGDFFLTAFEQRRLPAADAVDGHHRGRPSSCSTCWPTSRTPGSTRGSALTESRHRSDRSRPIGGRPRRRASRRARASPTDRRCRRARWRVRRYCKHKGGAWSHGHPADHGAVRRCCRRSRPATASTRPIFKAEVGSPTRTCRRAPSRGSAPTTSAATSTAGMIFGLRVSLIIGIAAAIFATIVGVTVGVVRRPQGRALRRRADAGHRHLPRLPVPRGAARRAQLARRTRAVVDVDRR